MVTRAEEAGAEEAGAEVGGERTDLSKDGARVGRSSDFDFGGERARSFGGSEKGALVIASKILLVPTDV